MGATPKGARWPLLAPGRRPQATGTPSQVSQYAATHDSAEQPQSLATWDRAGNNPRYVVQKRAHFTPPFDHPGHHGQEPT
jgi:hypothetical protein